LVGEGGAIAAGDEGTGGEARMDRACELTEKTDDRQEYRPHQHGFSSSILHI
jgi:hypothetical protein